MATVRWIGGALAVAEVQTITVGGTWANNDTATMTINNKSVVVTFGAGVPTTAQVAAALKAAWEGDAVTAYGETRNETGNNVAEFAEITATVSGSVVTLTHDTKGTPFTVSVSETSAAGTLTPATSTAASGPNHWSTAANWSGNAVPVSTDDVYLENSDDLIKYGLAQSAVTLTSLNVMASFVGQLGLPEDEGDYTEYRATDLAISATTLNVGDGEGSGSGLLRVNVGANVCTLNVRRTGSAVEPGREALLWRGTHASNVANVFRGSAGIASRSGETSTIATLRVGYVQSVESDANVRCGAGVTLTTIVQSGGNLQTNSNLTTFTGTAGVWNAVAGTVTTLNCQGTNQTNYLSTGTCTTANVWGILDLSKDMRPRTITNTTVYEGASLLDPHESVTFTTAISIQGRLSKVTLDLGYSFSLQRS